MMFGGWPYPVTANCSIQLLCGGNQSSNQMRIIQFCGRLEKLEHRISSIGQFKQS